MSDDLYDTLGVSRAADAEALKKAYKKLVRELHPDRNPGRPDAERRFKLVNHAYSVLSEPNKRALYDEFGADSLARGFDAERARAKRARGKGGAPPSSRRGAGIRVETVRVRGVDDGPVRAAPSSGLDMLGSFFGRRKKSGVRGADCEADLTIDLAESLRGTQRMLQGLPGGQPVRVTIPRGVADGTVLRIPGEGAPSVSDGPSGDLRLRIRVRPHAFYSRDGHHLVVRLPVTMREAYFGARIKVPTADGAVRLTVPAASQTGDVLRVRGKGLPSDAGPGDLLVHLMVQIPVAQSLEVATLVDKLAAHERKEPRADVSL